MNEIITCQTARESNLIEDVNQSFFHDRGLYLEDATVHDPFSTSPEHIHNLFRIIKLPKKTRVEIPDPDPRLQWYLHEKLFGMHVIGEPREPISEPKPHYMFGGDKPRESLDLDRLHRIAAVVSLFVIDICAFVSTLAISRYINHLCP